MPSPSSSGLVPLASFFSSPHFRPLMLPLTCTASTGCPLPETQVQLSMVIRSVYRQMLDRHTVNTLLFRCCLTFHLSVERCKRKEIIFTRISEVKLSLMFSQLVSTSNFIPCLHPLLQFCRSLSQIPQQLYHRVGSIQSQLTFYPP